LAQDLIESRKKVETTITQQAAEYSLKKL
jgi:hypothetical protein